MWPTDTPPWWRATGGSDAVGPVMTTLRTVVARLAWLVRCAGIGYIVVQVAVWRSFYAADPWCLAGPAAAIGWAAVVLVYLRRRWPGPVFACLDSVVYLALALGAQGSVPAAVRDDAFGWLVIAISSQLVVPAWYAPSALCVPLALASPVAYRIGAQLVGAGGRSTTMAAILLTMLVGVHIYCRRALYGRAAAADGALEAADRDASEQYAILSRNVERREHERLLHDTILNTLTALARVEGVAQVVGRCRRDVALIEAALTDPSGPGQGPGLDRRYGDLVGGVQAVAAELRARGLVVHVEIADDGASAIPAPVATALANAVREALSNVAAHAGTGEAWVEVGLRPDRIQLTVRDQGAGFDPARVDPARLGLRRSIAERLRDRGGHASISSAPHQGTVVRMCWPAPAQPGQPDQSAQSGQPDVGRETLAARGSPPW
jgi:signal transduction histidine kinase